MRGGFMKWYNYVGLYSIYLFAGAILMLASEELFGRDGWQVWVGCAIGICIYAGLAIWHDYCYEKKWRKENDNNPS
jgi:hypothetical protein